LKPAIPANYGEDNTFQEENIENSQALDSNADSRSFSHLTLAPNSVSLAEDSGVISGMCVQAQFPTSDGPGSPLPTIDQTDTGNWSSMGTGIDPTQQDNWGFYNPQVFPTQMTYPQMALNTVSSPMGYPFQMNATTRPRIYCAWPLCMESFARPSDLERHRQSVHLGIKHHCFWPGCHNNHGKGYVRCDKLRAHQKEKHGFA
jgi:hypothetical protein